MRKDNNSFEDNLKRLHVLSGIKPINENKQGTLSTVVETVKINDLTYGIVKEGGSYYIKSTASDIINESTLGYIGGEANRREFKYNSYADALKNLNMIKISIQECSMPKELEEDTDMDDSSDAGQVMAGDEVSEQLEKDIMGGAAPEGQPTAQPAQAAPESQPQPAEPAPAPAPEGGQPSPEADAEFADGGDNGGDQIDHYVGKLTGELRNQGETLGSDALKGIINSVLSAIDLQKIDPDTRFEIGKRIKDGKNHQEDDNQDSEQPVDSAPAPEGQPSAPEVVPADDTEQFNEEKYPWNKCEKDQEKEYGSKETADKVCGAIKAKNENFDPKDDEKINEFFHNNRKAVIMEGSNLKVKNMLVETKGNEVIISKGDKSYTYNVSEKTIFKLNQLKEHKTNKLMNEEIANFFKKKI